METPQTWDTIHTNGSFTGEQPTRYHLEAIQKALGGYLEVISPKSLILDIGAGTNTPQYLPTDIDWSRVHAMDYSKTALAKNPASKKIEGDVTKPFKIDDRYGLVMNIGLMTSLTPEMQAKFMMHVLGILEHGGLGVFIDYRNPKAQVQLYPFNIGNLAKAVIKFDGFSSIEGINLKGFCYDDRFRPIVPLDLIAIQKSKLSG